MLRDSTGGYLSSVAELRAPSPEAAAHYLDVAIAARASHAQVQSSQQQAPAPGSATLLYTLHIYQYAVDKSGKGGGKFISFFVTLQALIYTKVPQLRYIHVRHYSFGLP